MKWSLFIPIMVIYSTLVCSCTEWESDTNSTTICTSKDGIISCRTLDEKNNLIRSFQLNEDSVLHGTYIEYYENGTIKSEGEHIDGVRAKWFKNYDIEGNLIEIEIYKYSLVTHEVVLDQHIRFDSSGDTLYDQSYFLRFDVPDSMFTGDTIKIKVQLFGSKYKQDIQAYAGFYREGSEDLYVNGLERTIGNGNTLTLEFNPQRVSGTFILEGFIEDLDRRSLRIGNEGDSLYNGLRSHLGQRFIIY